MISLDKKILEKDSRVARRMVEYGRDDELFILIPNRKKESFALSQAVHVIATGGNKIQQFFRLKEEGEKIMKKNNIEEITTQDPFFTGLAGCYLKKKLNAPLEVQMHGDFFGDYYKKHWFRQLLARRSIACADTVRVVGERVKKSLVERGISEEKIWVKPIAIDESRLMEESNVNLHKKYAQYKKIFLVLSRLEPVKNIAWLVDLWKNLSDDYLLLIVGRGTEEDNLRLQASDSKLKDNIKFEPWTEDPYGYIKTADCVLFPSLSEGYGLVPMEASALGAPIVMNDVGVANYELKPSENVKIIPIENKQAWIDAILNI
jgi:glycosyltransferase involved in cell wall biosynthesis